MYVLELAAHAGRTKWKGASDPLIDSGVEIFTRRRLRQIINRFPSLSQEDIAYLIQELTDRKRILSEMETRLSNRRTRERSRIQQKIVQINEGIRCLYFGHYRESDKSEMIGQLFEKQV